MKRQLLVIAALAALASTAPHAALAQSRDDDRGRRAERWERSDNPRGQGRGAEGSRGEGRDSRRWVDQDRGREGRAEVRRDDDERRARVPALGYGDERRGRTERYDSGPPARGFAPPASARRGGYLPDSYRGSVVEDYRRYRLRPPPQGYAWVRVGDGFALVSLADGRVFDMVQ
ncbi:RcnB family protein [Phenylobacterium sp.]|uniref:RcnB family protein n=1 Tax=Phenylobacterium sp. TaxID=1871053 RepID=UPI00301DDE72